MSTTCPQRVKSKAGVSVVALAVLLFSTTLLHGIIANDAAKTVSSDGSISDTQAAVNYVDAKNADGWVLTVGSAGASYTWGSQLSINISHVTTIKGASATNRPTITSAAGGTGISMGVTNGKTITIRDFIFNEWNTSDSSTLFQISGSGVDCWRITNCKFNHGAPSKIVRVGNSGGGGTLTLGAEGPYGLVDNCQCGSGAGFYFFEVGQNWRRPMTWGTNKAFYVEDCTFTGSSIEFLTAVDSWNGARYVFRHNTLTNMFVASHGADSAGTLNSVLQMEVMHNTFTVSTAFDKAFFVRGGTFVFFDNKLNGAGYNFGVKMTYFRATPGTNTAVDRFYPQDYVGTMMPCSGYVGTTGADPKWPSEPWGSVPAYIWGNTGNAPLQYGIANSNSGGFNAPNRDYFLTPKPGYTEYTYPHPLRTGGSGTSDVTPPTVSVTAPANLATVSGTVSLTATAADETGLASVDFYVDGVLKLSDTVSPYAYSWDSTTTVNGAGKILGATANDTSGNVTSSQVSVTVNNPVAAIAIAPSVLAWGDVEEDTAPADKTIVVTNSGAGTLAGVATVAAPFTIQSGGTYSLAAGATQDVVVRYRPTMQHRDSQNVSFTGGGGASATATGTAYTLLGLTFNAAAGLVDPPFTIADSTSILANGSFESDLTSWGGTGNRSIVTAGVSSGSKAVRFNVQTVCPRGGWSVHFVDSQNVAPSTPRLATHVFDGSNSTFWHTDYSLVYPNPNVPHTLDINLGASYAVSGLRILPRQDGYSNGRPSQYEIYVSTDGATWGTAVSTGTLQDISSEQEVRFTPKTGQYVRFKAMTEVLGRAWTSIAELNVLHETTVVDGSLSQTFVTTPASTYTLLFDLGIDSTVTGAEQRLQIGVQGSASLLSQTASILSTQSGAVYTPKSYTFVADSASTTLTFTDASLATVNANLLLDNVRVTGPSAGTTIGQVTTVTDPLLGGSAVYYVNVTEAAEYTIAAMMNGTAGSVAIDFVNEPGVPEKKWTVPPTTGLALRTATWALDGAGSGSSTSKKWTLPVGVLKLTIRGLTPISIGDITISKTVEVTPPATPNTPSPAASATDVDLSISLSIVSSGATSYDYYLDTIDGTTLVAGGHLSGTFQPAFDLIPGTLYYAKVITHNTSGDSAPFSWTFTTVVPEVAPSVVEPASGATNVPTNILIKWNGEATSSYRIKLGTVNPPPIVEDATVDTLTFNPGILIPATLYYLAVESSDGSLTSGVQSFTTASAPAPTPPPDVGDVPVPAFIFVP